VTSAARTEAARLGINIADVTPSLGGFVGVDDVKRHHHCRREALLAHHRGGALSAPLQPEKPQGSKPASGPRPVPRQKEGRKSPPFDEPVGPDGKRYKSFEAETSAL